MKMQQLHCPDLASLPQTVGEIIALAQAQQLNCLTLEGPMGAGKTTFVKEFARQLQVADLVQSPTFGIVNEYALPNGQAMYHFDCYRLKNLEEAFQIGVEEYLDQAAWSLIEWPGLIESLLPRPYLGIIIASLGSEERKFSLQIHE